jgi:hypothetical protein
MTPIEKSAKLTSYYLPFCNDNLTDAKQCALIAVDEIISELAYTQNYVEDAMNKIQVYISYWQEVKQEIETI